MKINVNKEGSIFIDDNELTIDEITPELLEKILDEGLNDNVVFNLPEDTSHPVASLIKELKDLTLKDSEFRVKLGEIMKEQEENNNKISIAETSD